VLQECDGQTRLISRNRLRLPTFASRIGMAPMIPGSLVMERKMLPGIKARAEGLAATNARRIRRPRKWVCGQHQRAVRVLAVGRRLIKQGGPG